jgi:hypothetical protein
MALSLRGFRYWLLSYGSLYSYAAQNWGHHASVASAKAEQLIIEFLKSETKVSASSQAIFASGIYSGHTLD